MPILIEKAIDPFDKKPYLNAALLNNTYVAPPKGAKPWGGKNPPKGSYNINLKKYNRIYSLMGIPWSKLIDTKIVIEAKCSLETAVAHVLWQLTFDGWTEAQVVQRTAEILETIGQSMKEIKEGKCVTLPPKTKGGFKVVIPDSVNQKLIDLINKKSK